MKHLLSFSVVVLVLVVSLLVISFRASSEDSSPFSPSERVENKDLPSIKLSLEPEHHIMQGGILVAKVETEDILQIALTATVEGRTGTFFERSPHGVYEAIFGIPVDAKPGIRAFVVRSPSGEELAKTTFHIYESKFLTQNITVSKSTKGLQPLPGEMEAIQSLKVSMTSARYWSRPFISPTPDCQNSPFGVRRYHNGVYTQDYHKGVDLRSPYGRPIRAIADGVVKVSAANFRLHGGTVGIDHGQGLNSIYIHMSRVTVKEGDKVQKGDIIGYVGSTGFATGPHLHWGLYVNGVPVNPDSWIPVNHC